MRAGECWVTADRKRGQELAKMPKAKGNAGPGRGKAGAKAGLAFIDAPTRAELGIGKGKRGAKAVLGLGGPTRAERKANKLYRAGEKARRGADESGRGSQRSDNRTSEGQPIHWESG